MKIKIITDAQAQQCCNASSKNLREFMKVNKLSSRQMSKLTGLSQNTIRNFRKNCHKAQGKTFWKIGAGISEHPGTLYIVPLKGIEQLEDVHEDPCPLGLYYDQRCPYNN